MGKGRTPCCDKARVKKGPWSQAEDLKLLAFVQRYGHTNWRSLPKLAGLARCGKSCRLRWVNYLRPDVKRGCFTPQEEETIIRLQSLLGNKWSKIASHFPGRTDNEIKNVWNTHLKKRTSTTTKNDSMSPTSSNCTTDENINEVLEIPDEPNMVQLWDSLMLDDRQQPSISDCTTFATFQGNTHSNHHTNNNSLGWQFGMPENFEHEIMTTIGNDQEKNTCAQLQEEALNMESYLEILSWPSSPNYDTYLGF